MFFSPLALRLSRGGSRIFFRRGCTRLLLYFNTNKPHSFFFCFFLFFCRIPVVLENRRSSRGGGGGAHPCTLPLDPPLLKQSKKWTFDLSLVKYRLYTPTSKNRQICNVVRLHLFTRLICIFYLGLPSLPFPNSLVKLTATRSDFLNNPRELQRVALPYWFEPPVINGSAKRLLLQICAIACQKQGAAETSIYMLFCLIYFFAPFPYITFRIVM